MAADFLFELGCEELPPSAILAYINAFSKFLSDALQAEGFDFGKIDCYATPRRLAFIIRQINEQLSDKTEIKKGPPLNNSWGADGKPSAALLGFAKSLGIDDINKDTFEVLQTGKGEWLSYKLEVPGQYVYDVLPKLILDIFSKIFNSKLMRWGASTTEFVRPVHWLVMLYGNNLIDSKFFNVTADRITYGHRFHRPRPIILDNASQYEDQLLAAKVIASPSKRLNYIKNAVAEIAGSHNAEACTPNDLLNEINCIVEWPKVYLGKIDENFLTLPHEVINTSLQVNQRLITLYKNNKLLPYFIAVANIDSQDPQRVISGNEQIVRARLSDALFFYHQDMMHPLDSYVPKLAKVIFRNKMGTLLDKTNRLCEIVIDHAQDLDLNHENALLAAKLSQCDLLTSMVNEFPELQGIMGFYYAKNHQEPILVAEALKDYYHPKFADDVLPKTSLGLLLAISDRIDNLVGSFMFGQQPSGVKDPFKLRRQALAIVRLLTVIKPASFRKYFDSSWNQWNTFSQASKISIGSSKEIIFNQLKSFILERLIAHYENLNIPRSVILAVLARGDDCFFDVQARVVAVQQFLLLPEAEGLLSISKRVTNILAKEQVSPDLEINPNLFGHAAEKKLYDLLYSAMPDKHDYLHDYLTELKTLADLQDHVNYFFDAVLVMDPDLNLRNNRLLLLKTLQKKLHYVVDLSMV